jgi:hypothetical protein
MNDLVGFNKSQEPSISNILLDNFINLYDWGFLDKGGFVNNNIPSSGMYGGEKTRLRPVQDPNYTTGQVWQAHRPNWVWETGVSVGSPINISGVFVTGVFRPVGNTTQPYHIDYVNGRVVFNSPISVSSNVRIEYSSKWINVIPAQGVPWFREIQQGSQRAAGQFEYFASGNWAQLGQTRVPLPTIAIDVSPPASLKPFQLGGGQWVNNDILFHVVAENEWECTNILDKIIYQNDRTISLYDVDQSIRSGVAPLDYRNSLTPGALPSGLYPNLINKFKYLDCYIKDSKLTGKVTQLSPDLYVGTVRCTTETRPI